ncbi:unnamed protein product [Prorocentrum cordatum]|uniref:Uncharacterized protein n=1 Tax=Prorocentrum cordatum TaxID=2364126 RepID=A0ABN9XRW1_9DINO|nr:unnamed protein product [Polarella glacialis]
MLPNLLHLKLSGSSISYLRELGTGLRRLEVLWLSCCGLQDISGIAGTMPELRELFLPFNDISDLSPLSAHEVLEVASLWMCTELRDLTLRCNPVCEAESFSRSAVLELLPQLAVLDDEEGPTGVQDAALDFVSASAAAVEPLQTAHLGLAAALAEAAELPAVQSFSEEPSELALLLERLKEAPPGSQAFSSWLRPLDRQSPSHAADASGCDSGKFRFENSMNLQGSCESSSTLTCGSLLSGNAVHAARQRRRHAPAASREGELDIRSLLRRHRAEGGVGASPASARGHEAATPSSAADAPAERPQTALAMEELRQRAPRAPPRGSARRSLSGPAGAGGAGDCGSVQAGGSGGDPGRNVHFADSRVRDSEEAKLKFAVVPATVPKAGAVQTAAIRAIVKAILEDGSGSEADGGRSRQHPGRMAAPRANCHAAVLDGRVYLMGGWADGGSLLLGDEVFDVARGTWDPPRAAHADKARPGGRRMHRGRGLRHGGARRGRPPGGPGRGLRAARGAVEAAAPPGEAALGLRRRGRGRQAVRHRGPEQSGRHLADVERLDPGAESWARSPPLPSPIASCAVAACRGRIFVFGGWGSTQPLPTASCFDPRSDRWEVLPPMPTARAVCPAATSRGRVYVIGGRCRAGQATNAVECYDVSTRCWTECPRLAVAQTGCVALAARC